MFDWWGRHWRDVVDVASAVGTVIAAVLALVAIRNGNKQAKASADALVRERRVDFDLDQLDKMGEGLAKGLNVAFIPSQVSRGLSLLPADEFPMLRQWFGMSSTPAALAALTEANQSGGSALDAVLSTTGNSFNRGMRDEVDQAIKRRLAERG